jgi:hypothetical protein
VKKTSSFLGIRNYPMVRSGASIWVPAAPAKRRKERREERFDWIGLVSVIVGGLSAIATLVLLSRR